MSGPPAETQEAVPRLARTPAGRQRIKDALVAFSLADICLVTAWFPPLHSRAFAYFTTRPTLRSTLVALTVNLVGLSVLAYITIQVARRYRSRRTSLLFDCLFLLALLVPLNFYRVSVAHAHIADLLPLLKLPWVALGLLILVAAVVWQHHRAARLLVIALAILSPLAVLNLSRALWDLAVLEVTTAEPDPPPLAPVSPGQPRVLWLILDEIDQRLLFEQRPAFLQLPEFDRLRRESVYATNAYPPADKTRFSLPALISGRPLTAALMATATDLSIIPSNGGATVRWSTLPSVFGAARRLGVNTALVGWYNPYPRVLGRDLNYATWYPFPGYCQFPAEGIAKTVFRQLAGVVIADLQLPPKRLSHAVVCRESLAESLTVATNQAYGLVFFHLPVPHTPGIYLPDKDLFTTEVMADTTGYFNNLMLADRFLATLRRALDGSGGKDRTWLILSSDHSWRDSRAYDGKRDLRVPFLITPPASTQPVLFPGYVNTIVTEALALAILRREITNSDTATAWLEHHPSSLRTVTRQAGSKYWD